MTDYNPIPDNILEPDDPIPADLGIRWRDNPIAMFEGAPGAPRLQLAALDAGFTTAGGIGSYVFAAQSPPTLTAIIAGTVYAGSGLKCAGLVIESGVLSLAPSGAALSGSWRAMGEQPYTAGTYTRATLFLRIA